MDDAQVDHRFDPQRPRLSGRFLQNPAQGCAICQCHVRHRHQRRCKWLAKETKNKHINNYSPGKNNPVKNVLKFEYLNHIVDLPKTTLNFRKELGINSDSKIIIRYGGRDTFDLNFVHNVLRRKILEESDLYILLCNTNNFITHPRVIYLEEITEKFEKSKFLNTGDVFLHARLQGESFGLSLLESLYSGVPSLTWKGGLDKNHLELVPKKWQYKD